MGASPEALPDEEEGGKLETTVVGSRREVCMAYLWGRIQSAWEEGDAEQAHHLHAMYTNLEHMSDEEYIALVTCDCEECTCAH